MDAPTLTVNSHLPVARSEQGFLPGPAGTGTGGLIYLRPKPGRHGEMCISTAAVVTEVSEGLPSELLAGAVGLLGNSCLIAATALTEARGDEYTRHC